MYYIIYIDIMRYVILTFYLVCSVPPGANLLDLLGVLGSSGLTAYFGLTDVGKHPNYPLSLPYTPSSTSTAASFTSTTTTNTINNNAPGSVGGPTIVISGAAGAVGTTACQLARALYGPNAHIIGIASASKLSYLTSELGGGGVVDVAIDYRAKEFRKALRAAVALGDEKKLKLGKEQRGSGEESGEKERGKGVDVFFDNVGGQVLDTVLPRMAIGGRVVLCGSISDYSTSPHPHLISSLITLIKYALTMVQP